MKNIIAIGQALMSCVDKACFENNEDPQLQLFRHDSNITPVGYIKFSSINFITIDVHVIIMKRLIDENKVMKYHGMEILIKDDVMRFLQSSFDVYNISEYVVPIVQISIPMGILKQMWRDYISNNKLGVDYRYKKNELSIREVLKFFDGVSFYQQIELKKYLEPDKKHLFGFPYHLYMIETDKISKSSFGLYKKDDYRDAILEDL